LACRYAYATGAVIFAISISPLRHWPPRYDGHYAAAAITPLLRLARYAAAAAAAMLADIDDG